MVIEANRDAAEECVLRAREALRSNDMEKMERLLRKAKKLDPSCDVKSILSENGFVSSSTQSEQNQNSGHQTFETNSEYSHDDHYDNVENSPRKRKSAPSPEGSPSEDTRGRPTEKVNSNSDSKQKRPRSRSCHTQVKSEYTDEDFQNIERIRHCKDYYEIIQIKREEFSESLLKRKYRELALKLHPDKCKAPGSTEAFKALGNAYAVLSNDKKRQEYDRYGSEEERSMRRNRSGEFYEYDINRGFEADISPEDIFDMFFGAGFSSGSVNHRNRTRFRFHRTAETTQEASPILQLLQLLPILVIFFGGLLIQLFSTAPPFSLSHDSTYYIQRTTENLRVPYYVKQDFEESYGKRIGDVERQVEDSYISMLQTQCYREKSKRDAHLWTARMRGDADLWRRAQEMELIYCRKLEEIYR